MAETSVRLGVKLAKVNSPLNLNDFVEYVEKQARTMEQSGWQEGHGLRKWISELRKRSYLSKALGD